MNPKAQASLEYLLTYGWALILIATVIGVLVFIASTPADEFRCSVDDPTKFIFKGFEIPETPGHSSGVGYDWWTNSENKMLLQNLTGGKISVTSIQCWGGSTPNWIPCAGAAPNKYLMDPLSMATINGAKWTD